MPLGVQPQRQERTQQAASSQVGRSLLRGRYLCAFYLLKGRRGQREIHELQAGLPRGSSQVLDLGPGETRDLAWH